MVFKQLGSTGEEIPAIGLGTWEIGGRETPDYSRDKENIEILQAAIEMGYTHIDTAEYYGGGHTEELLGEAIKTFDRSKLFITSKVWPTHLSKEELPKALKRSLKRLGTDYIDLYLIHWPVPDMNLKETLTTMAELSKAGYIRYTGVSNFDMALLKKSLLISPVPIVCNQVLYNIEDREPENELLPFCQENGITLTAYTPLKKGSLSKHTEKVLKKIAKKHNATIYQIMLSWLISKDNVIAIPRSTNIQHLKENLEAADIILEPADLQLLD